MSIENTILSSLVFKEDFTRRVLPYVVKDYFQFVGDQVVFKFIRDHFLKYNACPSIDTLSIDLEHSNLNEQIYEQAKHTLSELNEAPIDDNWLIDNTEQFCKRRAFHNAVVKSAELLENNPQGEFGSSMDLMQDALSVSFDNNIGHDYLEDAEERYEYHTRQESKLECDLQTFNRVLRGGFVNESLTVFLMPTGVGKSMFMGHFASSFLMQGKNVLYITMEMPEKQVGGRVDAHLLDISMDDLPNIEKNNFMSKILGLKKKTMGKFVIKQYPPHSAHSGHFRHLINELMMKKKFRPDVIFVDYLGICAAARAEKGANSYERQKTVAEELRGLAMEFKLRMFTAAQVNKEGTKNIDFDITDVAESWGIPHTADYMYGGVSTEEMEALGQMKLKRLKDRHNDKNKPSSFLIGIDRTKMRLFDLPSELDDNDKPVFDNSKFASKTAGIQV